MLAYVYADSESESEDSSVPNAGNLGDSNDGGHIDPEVGEVGDVSEPNGDEDGDEGGSEHSEDFPEEEGRFHTIANYLRNSMFLQ